MTRKERRTKARRRDHDHRRCVRTAMAAAKVVCERRAVRLTDLRRRVLELVWESHRPVGAYQILERLRRDGRPAAPPTVYRALEFLLSQSLIHRIEGQNAFVGCAQPELPHQGQFLICRSCGDTIEIRDDRIEAAVRHSADGMGFRVQHQTVEVLGLCPDCPSAEVDTA